MDSIMIVMTPLIHQINLMGVIHKYGWSEVEDRGTRGDVDPCPISPDQPQL